MGGEAASSLPRPSGARQGETDAADFRVDRRNKLIAVLTFGSLSALLSLLGEQGVRLQRGATS